MSISDGSRVPAGVPRSPFSSILNFRDVGQTINQLSQSQSLQPSLIYRSARPDEASAEDLSDFQSRYKIQTIIDLRSQTELHEQSKKLKLQVAHGDGAGIDRMTSNRVHVDLNGGPFARALLKKLSWSSYSKLIILYAAGWRLHAIRILGTEVMEPRGLTGLANDSLDYSKPAIRAVFDILGDRSSYPVLIHCTQGKDRTGLIIILLLLLLNVPAELVDQDYRASTAELVKEEQARLKEIRAVGLGPSFADCPEGFVESVLAHLRDNYGGSYEYLKGCDVSVSTLENIKRILGSA